MAKEKKAHLWARDPNDWYVEDRACIDFLLNRETFPGPVLDPACGAGNIVRACLDRGIPAIGTDIVRRTYHRPSWFAGIHDFLADEPDWGDFPWPVRSLIFNPPYYRAKGAEGFIRRPLAAPTACMVAAVVNAKFLFGDGRSRGLFADHPPTRVWPIYPRPSMPPGEWLRDGEKAGGGTEDFAWLVWERDTRGSRISWSFDVV